MLDRLPLSTASLTLHLHLLENTWGKHVFPYGNPMSTAGGACIHYAVRTSTASTIIANLLFFELELGLMTIVKVC
jgi:hypothetical protein